MNIEVIPFTGASKERFMLVLFEEPEPEKKAPGGKKKKKEQKDPPLTAKLKRELEATREYLQSIIEEQEAMNEELRSANEEIQSTTRNCSHQRGAGDGEGRAAVEQRGADHAQRGAGEPL